MDKLNMTYKEKRKYIAGLERDYEDKESIFKKECNFLKNYEFEFNNCEKLESEYLKAKQLLSDIYSNKHIMDSPTWQEGEEYLDDLKKDYLDINIHREKICKNFDGMGLTRLTYCNNLMLREENALYKYYNEYTRIKIERIDDVIKTLRKKFK